MYSRVIAVLLVLGACALQVGAQSSQPNIYVFPLIVDGNQGAASFRSKMSVNSTDGKTPLACTVSQRNTSASFTGLDGFLYPTFVVDAGFSPLSQTLLYQHVGLSLEILSTSGQANLKSGYAELSCPNTVQTQLQFSYYDASNNKIGEATILPATKGNSFQFLIDRRDGSRLGFSLTNDSSIEGQFKVIARDQSNQVIDFNQNDTIQPWSQVSKFVDEELTHLPANFFGSIEIVGVPGSQSYAVGLQFTGSIFTTVQPLVRDTPLPF
ncbi:MAG TPA: hypothetical protein VKY31_04765 [Terriglobia bacterium]|nr:hypothetical protein [Terriglobia bacterium]